MRKTYTLPIGGSVRSGPNLILRLKVHDTLYIDGLNYIFLGEVNNPTDIPDVYCLYIYNGAIYKRTPHKSFNHMSRLIKIVPKPTCSPRTVAPGDNLPLKIEIHPLDDELMTQVKALLIKHNVTVGMFKEMYGDNKVDMNNDKSRLESKDKHTWSYSKFRQITRMLGYIHHIELFKMEEENDEAK